METRSWTRGLAHALQRRWSRFICTHCVSLLSFFSFPFSLLFFFLLSFAFLGCASRASRRPTSHLHHRLQPSLYTHLSFFFFSLKIPLLVFQRTIGIFCLTTGYFTFPFDCYQGTTWKTEWFRIVAKTMTSGIQKICVDLFIDTRRNQENQTRIPLISYI